MPFSELTFRRCSVLRRGRSVLLAGSLAAFLLLRFFSSAALADDEARRALELVRKAYGTLTGLTAHFVQTEERPGVGVTVTEAGTLSFRPPDMMRWDYEGKKPHTVVISGSRVWIHTPSRKQIILRQMTPQEMRRGAATFLTGLDGVEEDFTVQSRPTKAGESIPLDLFPLEDDLPYESISLLVAPGTGLLERITIHHKMGNVTTITFQELVTGVKLGDSLFAWKVPEGTEVIEP